MRFTRPRSVLLTVLAAVLLGAGCGAAPTTYWVPGPTSGPAASGSAAPTTPASSPAAPAASPSGGSGTSDTTFSLVGSKPCPESRFECVTLSILRDHFGAAGGATWDVTFAIQRAAKERIGTFVVITGGPGSSGIAVADVYTDYYDTSITDVYDIVFLDQRGIGLSEPIQCIDAAAVYYRSSDDVMDPDQRPAAVTTALKLSTTSSADRVAVSR
ncbi:MAG: hypothetical protein ACTS8Z_08460 [Candidatus Limnocylindrales bacterium]